MKRLLAAALAVCSLLLAPMAPAFAAPIPYINSPMDTPQALVNSAITSMNAGTPGYSVPSTCSGTTTGELGKGHRPVNIGSTR